jgi:hypothetical protein
MYMEFLDELLKTVLILPRVKIENYLLPYLDLRPCSQTTLPAEMPGGAQMGVSIDETMVPSVTRLKNIVDPKEKLKAIANVKKRMADAFEKVVEDSDQFKALYDWSIKLDLHLNQVPIRPTVHEMFLYKKRSLKRDLTKLMKDREKLRVKAIRKPRMDRGGLQFAYPEEYNPGWLKRMGRILGYPDCCSQAYAHDRVSGINVELRAATQLREALKLGNVDSHSYLTSYFFPCKPDCEKALVSGHKWHDKLKEIDSRLDVAYSEMIDVNRESVLHQPEIIEKFVSQFKGSKNSIAL